MSPIRVFPPFHTQLQFRVSQLRSRPLQILRRARRTQISGFSTTADPPPRASVLRRVFSFSGRAVLFTSLGFAMALAPAYAAAKAVLNPPSSEETLRMYTPENAEAQAIEDHINNHPLVASLRAQPDRFTESRPHLKISPAHRAASLTAGTLLGPGRVTVPPVDFTEKDGGRYVQIAHLGTDLCGHAGIVHGGFLATMLDEGMARCCFPVVPHNIAMTANLNINYRAPAPAGSYVVLHASITKLDGRKVWVEGRIETLVGEGETPVVLADATSLFISPRQAAAMKNLYPPPTK